MTEAEWLWGNDPADLVNYLQLGETARKVRLLLCGYCRVCWPSLTDGRSRRAVEVAEEFADGSADDGQRERAAEAAEQAFGRFHGRSKSFCRGWRGRQLTRTRWPR